MTSDDDILIESIEYVQDDDVQDDEPQEFVVYEECTVKTVVDEAEPEHKKERRLPSQMRQMATVFGLQMKQFSKSKTIYVSLILVFLIPVLAYYDVSGFPLGGKSIAGLLMGLPVMMAIIPSMLSGRISSSEFRNKTAYMLFPLPVSRAAYYFGRFFASLTLSVGIFSLAYGVAIFSDPSLELISFPSDFLGSYVICMVGVFAIAATAYSLSIMFKRGSVSLTVILTMFMPVLIFFLSIFGSEYLLPETIDYFKLLPQFNGYQALFTMDAGIVITRMIDYTGLIDNFLRTDFPPLYYAAVAAAWGILFLALGLKKAIRKEV